MSPNVSPAHLRLRAAVSLSGALDIRPVTLTAGLGQVSGGRTLFAPVCTAPDERMERSVNVGHIWANASVPGSEFRRFCPTLNGISDIDFRQAARLIVAKV